jgi:hypothetical protein
MEFTTMEVRASSGASSKFLLKDVHPYLKKIHQATTILLTDFHRKKIPSVLLKLDT